MLKRLNLFLSLIRFSHTIFALPFALSSAALAWKSGGHFSWLDLLGILLCMVFARSAAMALNRLADRKIDAANPRTAMRHLPAGLLTPQAVLFFFLVCSILFVASTAIFIIASDNFWPIYLSIPVLAFVCAYSFTKRFTYLSHFWLGASLMLGPIGAWIAILGLTDMAIPTVLGLAVLFWVAGFDIFYACQDYDFDRQAKLRSVPAQFGIPGSLRIALICHFLMVALLFGLYWIAKPLLGPIYLIGISAVALLLLYEHWLIRPDDLSRVNKAFFQVNGIISIGLFFVVLVQILVV
jgi:4-hydroxybenzoate polyprenyltransferase